MEEKSSKIAIIRVRGIIGIKSDIERTLRQFNLHKKNFCVVVENNESNRGMVKKVKDYVAWGEIDNKTYELLIEKKGEEYKGRISDRKGKIRHKKFLTVNNKKTKKYFRLNSPKKGYGRKGIKLPYSVGGSLGYRADKINELIVKMI